MKKEAPAKEELHHFLDRHCEVKTAVSPTSSGKHRIYIFHTRNCVLFMAEAYIQGMRNAIGQNEETMLEAKKKGDFSDVIMVYNWSAPEPGMDIIQLPEALVDKLTKEQAEIFLRNLQRIQKDIEEGTARKKALQELFSGKVTVNTTYALDGERQFLITGTKSESDRRGYAERYAEMAATNALFDLPKALNAALQIFLPEHARGKHFVEGRSNFHKKMRYGKVEAQTELLIGDEGAAQLTEAAKESAKAGSEIRKVLSRAILDPFGLSLKYYLGKHPLIKLPSRNNDEE